MNLLSIDDFKNSKLDPNCSIFDYLLEVTRVAKEKLKKENFNIKQEEVDFKHGKNLDKNSDLGRKLESKLKQEEGLKLRRSKIDKPLWPNPPPDLPENFKEHIVSKMGGSDWLLVIQKPVFFSDVNPGANRLSIPFSQIQRHEFLCKKEVEYLNDKKDMQVRLVEPSLEETTLSFRRWNMKNSSMYVLTKTWNSVVKNNQLKIDDVVQLWSFRVESSLCFALVKNGERAIQKAAIAVMSPLLIPATNASVFQKAMDLYKKQRLQIDSRIQTSRKKKLLQLLLSSQPVSIQSGELPHHMDSLSPEKSEVPNADFGDRSPELPKPVLNGNEAQESWTEELKKKNLKIKQGEEKKRQGLVFKLKYFSNNAEEAINFKLGKKLIKNGGLKRKLKSNKEEEGGLKLKRSKIGIPSCSNPPPDLPENFKEHIVGKMGGSDWLLVIQKPIFFSDVNPRASRFSIPFSQIQSHEFLYKKEAEDLNDEKSMEVSLLEPSLEETTLSFRRWNMVKSSMYVLTTMWNSVVKNNQLEIDDVVQLWSFRVESCLCFALVKVDDVQKGSEEWVRHSKSNENGASSSHQEEGHGGCRRISC
ncbi:hypothetical protein POUND7_005100 [Theobroma cacao]